VRLSSFAPRLAVNLTKHIFNHVEIETRCQRPEVSTRLTFVNRCHSNKPTTSNNAQ